MTKLIKLTEIMKEGDGTKTQQMLVQFDFIATVTTGELKKSGPHIIGSTKHEAVTFITFKNGQGTFVEESLEQIEKLVSNPFAFENVPYFSAAENSGSGVPLL